MFGFPRNNTCVFIHLAGSNIVPEDAWVPTETMYAHNCKPTIAQVNINSLRLKAEQCVRESSTDPFPLRLGRQLP